MAKIQYNRKPLRRMVNATCVAAEMRFPGVKPGSRVGPGAAAAWSLNGPRDRNLPPTGITDSGGVQS